MQESFRLWDQNRPSMIRNRGSNNKFEMRGRYRAEHFRGGVLLRAFDIHNDITNEGKNKIFNVMFNDATPIANNSWFIGLVNQSSFSAFAPGDTMASHAGWAEFIAYSQANRVAWGSVSSTAQSVSNTTPATFDFTGTGTIHGLFIVSNSTKNGSSGTLWSTAAFANDIDVVNSDQLKLTYTVNS